jgi:hypothetical protein
MNNEECVERLLREYILRHPPHPFQTLVGVEMMDDPQNKKGCYLVFREPGTFHDLVIAIKFVVQERRDSSRSRSRSRSCRQITEGTDTTPGTHWEHALFSGMAWRQRMRMCHEETPPTEQRTAARNKNNRNEGRCLPQNQANSFPPSLIIAATFTNQFGLELVGHVDESPMEDVQFRLANTKTRTPPPRSISMTASSSVSFSATLQYTTILGEVPIYRWQTRDNHESPWNLIGFVASRSRGGGGANPNENNTMITAPPRASTLLLSLKSLSTIVERNNSTIRSTSNGSCHPISVPIRASSPFANESPPPFLLTDSHKTAMVSLSASTFSFLRGALTLPSTLPKKRTFLNAVVEQFMMGERRSGLDINNSSQSHMAVMLDHTLLSLCLEGVIPSDTRQEVSPYQNKLLPFAPTTIMAPNPLGPFARPYRCWHIHWEDGPMDARTWYPPEASLSLSRHRQTNNLVSVTKSKTAIPPHENIVIDKYKILELLFDDSEEELERNTIQYIRGNRRRAHNITVESVKSREGGQELSSPIETTESRLSSKRSRRKKRLQQRRAAERVTAQQNEAAVMNHNATNEVPITAYSLIVESRSDGSTSRREPDGAKKAHQPPSNGDIAINLLCPYQHPPGKMFVISHETPDQRALRHKIESSSCCRNLMGRFVKEFLSQQHVLKAADTRHYKWTIRKDNNDRTER